MSVFSIKRLFTLSGAVLAIMVAGCETMPDARPTGLMTLGDVTAAPRGFIALCRTTLQACPVDDQRASSVEWVQASEAADHAYWLSRVRNGRDAGLPGATTTRRAGRTTGPSTDASMDLERTTFKALKVSHGEDAVAKVFAPDMSDFRVRAGAAARPFHSDISGPEGVWLMTPSPLRPAGSLPLASSNARGLEAGRADRPFAVDVAPKLALPGLRMTEFHVDPVPDAVAATSSEGSQAQATNERASERVPAATRPLSRAQWAQVQRINARVNGGMRMRTDRANFGMEDVWQPGSDVVARYGDCEDFVLQKRHDLVAEGFGAGQLSIALVRTRWGEAHAVLLVNTPEGEYVLDNLSQWIMPWNQTDYEWVERQAPGDAMTWVRIGTPARS